MTAIQTAATPRNNPEDRLRAVIEPLIAPLGYELVAVEVVRHHHKTLRLFIDHLAAGSSVGIEDCVRVSRVLDEPLDHAPEVEDIFQGPYELEVSSPGVNRPLRQAEDFSRFAGRRVRVHVFRPLTAEETGNVPYVEENPRQKNFVGILEGLSGGAVILAIEREKHEPRRVLVPLDLISKANIEPVLELIKIKEKGKR